jgi:hypothetical protein
MVRCDSGEWCVNQIEGCAGLVTQGGRSPTGVTSPAPARSEQGHADGAGASAAGPSRKATAFPLTGVDRRI